MNHHPEYGGCVSYLTVASLVIPSCSPWRSWALPSVHGLSLFGPLLAYSIKIMLHAMHT